jgi:hypothetical protein
VAVFMKSLRAYMPAVPMPRLAKAVLISAQHLGTRPTACFRTMQVCVCTLLRIRQMALILPAPPGGCFRSIYLSAREMKPSMKTNAASPYQLW